MIVLPVSSKRQRLGEFLLTQNTITAEQLSTALLIQQNTEERIGAILIAYFKVKTDLLYRALAYCAQLNFIEPYEFAPDPFLLQRVPRHLCFENFFLPHYIYNDTFELVISNPLISYEALLKPYVPFNYQLVLKLTSPAVIQQWIQYYYRTEDMEMACHMLYQSLPSLSAKYLLSKKQKQFLAFFIMVCVGTGVNNASLFFSVLDWILQLTYASTTCFKFAISTVGISYYLIQRSSYLPYLLESSLPFYSVLIPLYREASIVPSLVKVMEALSYPRSRLQIIYIVEEDDKDTQDALECIIDSNEYVTILKVPPCYPRTKAKACNMAMHYIRGEYVTIYDAEDIPEPGQLKKAVALFSTCPPEVSVLQARLEIDNWQESWLTRMFYLEYSIWFTFWLKALEWVGGPIPLGGTSCHFRINALKRALGWDPYNVTEDAEMGMRLACFGYSTYILDSVTFEEAPITFSAWLNQRTRWIKGYMQTYIVYMRHPYAWFKQIGFCGFVVFQFFIGLHILSLFLGPYILFKMFNGNFLGHDLTHWTHFIGQGRVNIISLMWIAIMMLSSFAVISLSKRWRLLGWSFTFPLYWLLHYVASVKAVKELLFKPHYWSKTKHGVTRLGRYLLQ